MTFNVFSPIYTSTLTTHDMSYRGAVTSNSINISKIGAIKEYCKRNKTQNTQPSNILFLTTGFTIEKG